MEDYMEDQMEDYMEDQMELDDFLEVINSEGLDYALNYYGLKSEDCPPGEIRDAYATLERIVQTEEWINARKIIEKAVHDAF